MSGFGFLPAQKPVISSGLWTPEAAAPLVPAMMTSATGGAILSNGGYTVTIPSGAVPANGVSDETFMQSATEQGVYFTLDIADFASTDICLAAFGAGTPPSYTAAVGALFSYDPFTTSFNVSMGDLLTGGTFQGTMSPPYNNEQMCLTVDDTGTVRLYRGTNPSAGPEFSQATSETSGLDKFAMGSAFDPVNGYDMDILASPPVEYDGVSQYMTPTGPAVISNPPSPRNGRVWEVSGLLAPLNTVELGELDNGYLVYFDAVTGDPVSKTIREAP